MSKQLKILRMVWSQLFTVYTSELQKATVG